MAVSRIPSILPPINRDEALAVTRIHSLAGLLPKGGALVRSRPFRVPHHSASLEGIIGGGKRLSPGEISLAHCGILFLDESPEFRKNILQSLREPLEEGRVSVVRAGYRSWFPSDFQLIMAANPCPCGNLGRDDRICLCGKEELFRYWRRIGGALLDRIDIRFPVKPVVSEGLLENHNGSDSTAMRARVMKAVEFQKSRFKDTAFAWNSKIPSSHLPMYCSIGQKENSILKDAMVKLHLSMRATASVLRVARTIADLEGSEAIAKEHLYEALQYRRYGDGDFFWNVE